MTCVNFYGTTETQRAVGYFVAPPMDEDDGLHAGATVPLGRGVEDVQLLVLNTAGQAVRIGDTRRDLSAQPTPGERLSA